MPIFAILGAIKNLIIHADRLACVGKIAGLGWRGAEESAQAPRVAHRSDHFALIVFQSKTATQHHDQQAPLHERPCLPNVN
jgi:hypothetical protein